MFRLATRTHFWFTLPKHTKLGMPSLSPTMSVGKVVKWAKNVGDPISQGDIICEVETDKATVPFEVQQSGFVAHLNKGQAELSIGETLAVIVKKQEDVQHFANYKPESAAPEAAPAKSAAPTPAPSTPKKAASSGETAGHTDRVVASPLAKKTASQMGVDLTKLSGSGPGGRIVKQDVVQAKSSASPQESHPKQPVQVGENRVTTIPLSSMRKTIAKRLTQSKSTVPHFYLTNDVRMTKLLALREQINKEEKEWGVKVSVNDIVMLAIARAIRDVEGVNYQWADDHIKKFQYVDLSMAVATPNGLITPIIFQACRLGLREIALKSKELAKKARDGKLQPNEFIGGTASVSNVGMFGVDSLLPIINPPQSLIVGVGATKKVLVPGPGNGVSVEDQCTLTVSVDHRVIDGALAAQWFSKLRKIIQEPNYLIM